jgi:hypothetical protein
MYMAHTASELQHEKLNKYRFHVSYSMHYSENSFVCDRSTSYQAARGE